MAIRHKMILINGQPGIGKTWTADRLMEICNGFQSPTQRPAKREGFREGLDKVMWSFCGATTDEQKRYFSSQSFKVSLLPNGWTGRKLWIHLAETAKAIFGTDHWVKLCADRIRIENAYAPKGFLWISDSFGFPEEFFALIGMPDFELLTVYIGEEQTTEGSYRQFNGDSRFDLSRHCTIRVSNSTAAVPAILQALNIRGW